MLDRRLILDPQVALRPEPFGALAYHYGTRRLIFLKHPDVVRVARALGDHDTVAATLTACDIDEGRWPSFERALASLVEAGLLRFGDPDAASACAHVPKVVVGVGTR